MYVSEIAYEHFYNFSKVWGEKYVTSNVQILNPATGQFEYIGAKYRYFTTDHGLRIMAFGVLFDFTGNSNVSKVTKGKDMVKQQWFLDAVNFTQPIDLFLVTGHNPILTSDAGSTFGLVRNAIRAVHPTTPIQVFGGHSHIRAFQAYDETSTGLESGESRLRPTSSLLTILQVDTVRLWAGSRSVASIHPLILESRTPEECQIPPQKQLTLQLPA